LDDGEYDSADDDDLDDLDDDEDDISDISSIDHHRCDFGFDEVNSCSIS
jgi:hypothetical protein